MSLIERLEWDSNFFGYETGKLEIGKVEDFDDQAFMENAKAFHLVYVFSPIELHLKKLTPVGKKSIFSRKTLWKTTDKAIQTQSFDPKWHDYSQLEKLALESGKFSRFKTDPGFKNNEFQRLYKKWIDNSVNENTTFEVIVTEKEIFAKASASMTKKILGFATLSPKTENTAKIDLIAVSEKARKLDVASALITESLHRSKEKGFDTMEVATQNKNSAAMELYKKNGFKIKESLFVYHFWNL